jgi:hypothetical protein
MNLHFSPCPKVRELTFFNRERPHGDSTWMPSTDQLPGTTTGEFKTYRRRATDIPPDAPPARVRQALRAQVEDSLRSVCYNWPTGEFDRVVADVTATAMKYHGRERRGQSSSGISAPHIPGAASAIALVTSATHSVQKFLQLEILPTK